MEEILQGLNSETDQGEWIHQEKPSYAVMTSNPVISLHSNGKYSFVSSHDFLNAGCLGVTNIIVM